MIKKGTRKSLSLDFEFVSYSIKKDGRTILFNYRINFRDKESINFTETIELPKRVDWNQYPKDLISNLLSGIHLMLGVSYYKIYCPKKVKLPYKITENEARFWNKVYREGLGEFYFRNDLNPLNSPKFPFTRTTRYPTALDTKDRALVGIGGGKDSIIACELLRDAGINITGFVVPQTRRTMEIIENSIGGLGVSPL